MSKTIVVIVLSIALLEQSHKWIPLLQSSLDSSGPGAGGDAHLRALPTLHPPGGDDRIQDT